MEPTRAALLHRPTQYVDRGFRARIQEWDDAPGMFVLGRGVEQSRGLILVLVVDIGTCRDERDAAFPAVAFRSTHKRSKAHVISRVNVRTVVQQACQGSMAVVASGDMQRRLIFVVVCIRVSTVPQQHAGDHGII